MKHFFCIFSLFLFCVSHLFQAQEARAGSEAGFSKQKAYIDTPFTRANPRSSNYVDASSPNHKQDALNEDNIKESLDGKAQNNKRKYPKDKSKYAYSEKYVLIDEENKEPLTHWLVEVTFENGNLRRFISDEVGRVFEHKSVEQEYVTIKVLSPTD